jgi:gas vesicle protein
MFESKPKHSYIDLFEGIIIGGSLAAAATFIFGTKKGKELQKKLVNQYQKLGRTTKTMKDKFEKLIHLHTTKKIKRAVKKVKKKVLRKIA